MLTLFVCFDSTGHPIGATGLGQCAEICWQVNTDRVLFVLQLIGVGLSEPTLISSLLHHVLTYSLS